MKKFLFMFALLFCAIVGVNAQKSYEVSKVFDNVSVGITGGISSPLHFNSVTPFNTNFGLKLQKDFTPVVGVQVEGLAFVNDNNFSDVKTWVKATNVGVNHVVNMTNLFCGYKGSPRTFEVSTVFGFGWLHSWTSHYELESDGSDNHLDDLSAKSGIDLAFNLGNDKQHSIVVTPAIYWNLTRDNKVQFNKNHAQLALNVSYVYHFKTSNGTHHFKVHDVGLMNDRINKLTEENIGLKNVVKSLRNENSDINKEIKNLNERCATLVDNVLWVVQFKQGSSELSSDSKKVLDKVIKLNKPVDVVATASPEGTKTINDSLSRARADVLVKYLTDNGVTVKNSVGMGAKTKESNRLGLVTIAK